MRERMAQEIALVRSFEEADPECILLTAHDRRVATEAARLAGGPVHAQAARRAHDLLTCLDERVYGLRRVRRWTRVSRGWIGPVVVAAFLFGLATNALGPQRHISLLAFPLLSLLAWNFAVYGVSGLLFVYRLAGRRLLPGSAARSEGAGPDEAHATNGSDTPSGGGPGLLVRLSEWASEKAGAPDPDQLAVVRRALPAYTRSWSELSAPLARARLRMTLHAGAAAAVGGALAGMYLRGLSFAYEATWESTFLDAESVASFLGLVLGPAAQLSGFSLPDAAGLAALRAPAGAPAAGWIHLWAITAGATVLVPRTLLAIVAAALASRRERDLIVAPLDGSFRVLEPIDRGAGRRVDVLPYSYTLPEREADGARELGHEIEGRAAAVRLLPGVAYGAGTALHSGDEPPACLLVVFPLVQPPEVEVHGEFLAHLLSLHAGARVVAVVDRSPWRLRFDNTEDERSRERCRAWDRVVRGAGLDAVHVDLGEELRPDAWASGRA